MYSLKFTNINEIEEYAAKRRAEIRAAKDDLKFSGTAYYVSAD